jgi:oligopeptide/dipeptide ABC transporter ATP-binding protein
MASLQFRNVEKNFGSVKVIHGIGFDIADGEFTVLVGPSGCGKSTLLRMLAGLEEISGGTISIDGLVVNDVESKDRDIAMVFQSYALYPHMTVADNMGFSLKLRKADPKLTAERVAQAAKILNLGPYLERFPRELSGGQRQRVAIAAALVLEPKLLVADEPVSMLDVSVRAGILDLLDGLRRGGLGILMITHDLSTATQYADRILVMYLGRIVEEGPARSVVGNPQHPYTKALISVVPRRDPHDRRRPQILEGETPNPVDIPEGCRFHPRCPIGDDSCRAVDPQLTPAAGHRAACIKL